MRFFEAQAQERAQRKMATFSARIPSLSAQWATINEVYCSLQSGDISVFETNIRYVGGLLSAYALTGDELFLEKATHVADKLTPAFKSPTGIPYALINMRTGVSLIQQTVWIFSRISFWGENLLQETNENCSQKPVKKKLIFDE